MEEPKNNLKTYDSGLKYGYSFLGPCMHEYFKLKGKYVKLYPQEIITPKGSNKRMDICYLTTRNFINNIEFQSGITTKEKLKDIGEYKDFLERKYKKRVNSIIISRVDPKYCADKLHLSDTTLLIPDYIYKPPEECIKRFNNLEKKVNSKKELNRMECLDFAVLPFLLPTNLAKIYTEKLCYLFNEYKQIGYEFRFHIVFMMNLIMKHLFDEEKYEKLRKVIDMDVYESVQKQYEENLISEALKEELEIRKKMEENMNNMEENMKNNMISILSDPENKNKTNDELKELIRNTDLGK